jgi:DNA-binding NarL/FixJ family response regulator
MVSYTQTAVVPAPEGAPVRVLIADGNDLFRSGLKGMLRSAGHAVVADCRSGRDTVALAGRTRPDVVLMEATPQCEALAATRALAADPQVAVVMLACRADEALVLAALGAGAQGFLLKDAQPEVFADAVRSAAAGGSPLSPDAALHAVRSVRAGCSGEVSDAGLTARETDILRYVVDGLSNREIADLLVVSPLTIKHHVASILDKLGAANRVQAAVHAVRRGLV